MIAGIQLTFARLIKGTLAENYLFALSPEPFRRGEMTSDFLAFFGFGSGRESGRIVNQEMENNDLIVFSYSDDYTRDSSMLLHLLDTLGHEFYFEPSDVLNAFYYLAVTHGKDYTASLSSIVPVGRETKPHLHPLLVIGSHMDGRKFFAIGFNRSLKGHHFIQKFVKQFGFEHHPIEHFPFFDWKSWTGVSNKQHLRGLCNAMKQVHFMAESREVQNQFIEAIAQEASRVIEVG